MPISRHLFRPVVVPVTCIAIMAGLGFLLVSKASANLSFNSASQFGGSTPTATATHTSTSTPTGTALACSSPGSLDPTFDGDGKLTTSFSGSAFDRSKAVAIQPDGKIVAAGFTGNVQPIFAVARYNPDGTLDSTFDGDGKVTTAFTGIEDVADSLAIQSDGKIVVAGSSYNGSNYLFAVARYNTNGSLDTTFDGDGKVTTAVLGGNQAYSVSIQSDGRIVVAGSAINGPFNNDFAVVRYNTNGSLDNTFDGDGKVTTNVLGFNDVAHSVAIQEDGKIVLAGSSDNGSNNDFAIVRYNSDGSGATTFTTPVGSGDDEAKSVAIQPDGKIVVAGSTVGANDFAVIRLNGFALDPTFDGDGKVTTNIQGFDDVAESVAIQPDGKIVLAGTSSNGSNLDFAVVRYNLNGSLDTSFDSDGKVITPILNLTDWAFSLAIQPDGKIVASGEADRGFGDHDFALVRYGAGCTSPTPTNTSTNTPTNTPTDTPTGKPTPTLGTYPNTSVVLSDNITIMPDAPPTNTTSISVETSTNFVGELTADPVTSVVHVINAQHANITPGAYTVTVKAFGPGGMATSNFALTVTDGTACNGNPGFTSPAVSEATVGFNPRSVAVGDFNEDGIQDFATANQGSFPGNVSIRLGNGAGGFDLPAVPEVLVGQQPSSVAIGDFNGDGIQDFAVANANSSSISIRLGDGSGGFTAASDVPIGFSQSIAIGDFNGDGLQDFLAGKGSSIFIRLGDGNGGFTSPAVPEVPIANATSIAIGDFNNDGKQDFLANSGSGNVSIRLGDGNGGFASPVVPEVIVGSVPYSIAIGDFNGDGTQDFATANSGADNVSIRLGDGNGGFTSPAIPEVPIGSLPTSVAIGDFNNDGKQDLAVTNNKSANVSIRLGNGIGGFISPAISEINVDSNPRSVAVGDFNGDGIQDFVVANYFSDNTSVRLGGCFPFAITGTVTYGNAASPPKYISNVTLTASGSQNATTTTGAPGPTAGQYGLNIFGPGPYTVSLSKTTGQNGIGSNDAARIAQHVSSTLPFTNDRQRVAADVSGNGVISSNDAAFIARFVAGLGAPFGNTGQWRFYVSPGPTFPVGSSPTTRTYSSVTSNLTGEDYIGLLIGETTGNWSPSAARPAAEPRGSGGPVTEKQSFSANRTAEPWNSAGPERGIAVELPSIDAAVGKEIVVPVKVEGIADKGVISYEFDMKYDPLVMQPVGDGVDLKETASRGLSVVTNATEPGLLRVVVYGAFPIDQDGVLLNLRFMAIGNAGAVSPISFERSMFNEGLPMTATDGQVTIE